VGEAIPGRGRRRFERPLEPTAPQPASVTAETGRADRAAPAPAVHGAADRRGARAGGLNGESVAQAPGARQAASAGAAARGHPLREEAPGRAAAPGHEEAGPHPRDRAPDPRGPEEASPRGGLG